MTRNFDTTSPRSDQGSEIALSKIEKLWRTASDGAATDAEREAARNRALHLMAKYHIDDAQLAAGRADADEIVEGYWGWADGATSTYTNWGSGEPNGGGDENCAQLNWPLGSGEWNDADCYATETHQGYACALR